MTITDKEIPAFIEKIKFIDENYEPQLIFIVLPNKIVHSNEIERMCLNQRSIPVHIELMETINCSNQTDYDSLTIKLLTKLNCKIGGIPWTIVIDFPNVMTIGFHIWRDATNSTLYYGAFIVTMDLQKNAKYCRLVLNFIIHISIYTFVPCLAASFNIKMPMNCRLI